MKGSSEIKQSEKVYRKNKERYQRHNVVRESRERKQWAK